MNKHLISSLFCATVCAFTALDAAAAAPKKSAAKAKTAPAAKAAPVAAPSAGGAFTGFSASGVSQYGYVGAVYALNGNARQNGWLVRGAAGIGNYNYRTSVVPSGVINGTVTQVNLGIGYQHFFDDIRLSGFVGPAYENQNINANDPNNRSVGTVYGGHGQIELTAPLGSVANFGALGAYTSGNNNYYSNVSVGFPVCDGLQIGPEVAALGSRSYNSQRYGTFASLPVGFIKNLNVKFGVGFQRTNGRGPGSSDAYGAMGLGLTY